MKNTFAKFFAAAAIAGIVLTAGVATARKTDPIFEMRRTLHMAFGQHNITLEAPVGMCFFDESQYLEGSMINHMRKLVKRYSSEQIMAVFADCDEIAKFVKMPEILAQAAEEDIGGGMPQPEAEFSYTGTVSWLKPKLGRAPMGLQEYLDMREPDFRDDVVNEISDTYKALNDRQDLSLGDGLSISLFSPSPDKYKIDEKVRRSEAGVSVGFTAEFVAEYQKRRMTAVIGTTMLRKFPVQVSLGTNVKGKQKGRSLKHLHKTMDSLMAQIAKLNP